MTKKIKQDRETKKLIEWLNKNNRYMLSEDMHEEMSIKELKDAKKITEELNGIVLESTKKIMKILRRKTTKDLQKYDIYLHHALCASIVDHFDYKLRYEKAWESL